MTSWLDNLLFGYYPYICLAVFFIGSLLRFDRDQYTWKSDSSQLLRRGQLRLGSNLFHIGVLFLFFERQAVDITATCKLTGKTGVEMEALTAVAVAALTVYDMCKAVDRGMRIDNIRLVHKAGGKSGTFRAE